jgi:hypothetical protein
MYKVTALKACKQAEEQSIWHIRHMHVFFDMGCMHKAAGAHHHHHHSIKP